MPQDIQNFSDVLAINPQLTITVVVKFHGYVHGWVELNQQRCIDGANHLQVPLLDNINLVSNIDQFLEGSSGIEIQELTINGYNVIPKYQHYSSTKNGYHDKVGKWNLHIPAPFYSWYHAVSGQGLIA